VELRGLASMTPDVGRHVDTQLSWKYDGKDPGKDTPGAVRVVVRVDQDRGEQPPPRRSIITLFSPDQPVSGAGGRSRFG
jgi:hypothetical protein